MNLPKRVPVLAKAQEGSSILSSSSFLKTASSCFGVIFTFWPTEVKVWVATNPDKRDFRLASIGQAYKSTVLTAEGNVYTAKVEKPTKGFSAFFVELTFPSGMKYPFKFTTAVRVTPDVLPFPKPPMKITVQDLR